MEDTEKRDTQNDWGGKEREGGGVGGGCQCQRDVNEEMPSYAIDTHLTGDGHIVFRQMRGHEACGAVRCGAVRCSEEWRATLGTGLDQGGGERRWLLNQRRGNWGVGRNEGREWDRVCVGGGTGRKK